MARILVVDDDEDIREAFTEILEDEGHDVFEAENGSEVMAMAVSARINLILLDMAMPEMNGFEVMKLLNRDTQTALIPVIVVTGLGRPDHLEDARRLGTVDYINKPWADNEVQMRVEWALNGKRDEAQAV
ncbi:MAG: response regulator [Chloroflexi bacterium]|nr:response regulator [Chloroflexota bacterium]